MKSRFSNDIINNYYSFRSSSSCCNNLLLRSMATTTTTLLSSMIKMEENNNNNNNTILSKLKIGFLSLLWSSPILLLILKIISKSNSCCTTIRDSIRVMIIAGITSISLQTLLHRFLLSNNNNKKKKNGKKSINFDRIMKGNDNLAAYVAHNIVAFLLMIIVSTIGVKEWFRIYPFTNTAAERFLLITTTASSSSSSSSAILSSSRYLSSIIVGSFLFWDIPYSIMISKLRKLDVIVHHIVMLIIAIFGSIVLPTPYILYYFGIAELSSIPLIIYDTIVNINDNDDDDHTEEGKKENEEEKEGNETESKNSNDFIDNDDQEEDVNDGNDVSSSSATTTTTTTSKTTSSSSSNNSNFFLLINILQIITAVSFTIIRGISFPYITIRHFLPDCWSVIQKKEFTANAATNAIINASNKNINNPRSFVLMIKFLMFGSIGFTILQLTWFVGMVRTILNSNNNNENE